MSEPCIAVALLMMPLFSATLAIEPKWSSPATFCSNSGESSKGVASATEAACKTSTLTWAAKPVSISSRATLKPPMTDIDTNITAILTATLMVAITSIPPLRSPLRRLSLRAKNISATLLDIEKLC